jgi:hypothetical protein
LSNSGHLLYFFKKLKITLTGSNTGNLTMFKKIFQATRFTGVKKNHRNCANRSYNAQSDVKSIL